MTLNFDIVAIVIIILSIGFGYGRGFYKQLKITLSILAPFVVIVFAQDVIFSFINGLGLVDPIVIIIAKILGYFTSVTADDAKYLLVYFVLFISIALVIHLLVGFFAPSKMKNVTTFKSKASKFIGAGLGLVRGVCLALIVLFLMKEIAIIDFTTPITGVLVHIAAPIIGDITL